MQRFHRSEDAHFKCMLLKEERRVRKHRNIIYIYFTSKEHPSGGKEILGSECNFLRFYGIYERNYQWCFDQS
jgi:hypothetical protein